MVAKTSTLATSKAKATSKKPIERQSKLAKPVKPRATLRDKSNVAAASGTNRQRLAAAKPKLVPAKATLQKENEAPKPTLSVRTKASINSKTATLPNHGN